MLKLFSELPEELRVRLRQRAPASTSHTSWQDRCHFFSSFFWKKLLGAGVEDELPPGTTAEARDKAAHQRVARWTRGMDVFSKDYLFVPICGDLHWTLAIIVNSGAAAAAVGTPMELDAVAEAPTLLQPWSVMLHLDSIGGYHQSAQPVLGNWLAHEWSLRRGCSLAIAKRWFSAERMPYLRPNVPRLPDGNSCGAFIAEYARRFSLGAPETFTQAGYLYFMRRDWSSPAEAFQMKRDHLHQTTLSLVGLVDEPLPFAAVQRALSVPAPAAAAPADGDIIMLLAAREGAEAVWAEALAPRSSAAGGVAPARRVRRISAEVASV